MEGEAIATSRGPRYLLLGHLASPLLFTHVEAARYVLLGHLASPLLFAHV